MRQNKTRSRKISKFKRRPFGPKNETSGMKKCLKEKIFQQTMTTSEISRALKGCEIKKRLRE